MEYGLKPLGREKLWLWLMLAPTIIGLVFGTIGSLLATLGLSLFDWDLINPPTWAGFSNYIALFQNKDYIEAFANTLKFSALYVPGVVIISLLLAVLLNRKIYGVGIFRTVYFLPAVTSAVATALVWNMIYGRDTGILNWILESLGFARICWLCTDHVSSVSLEISPPISGRTETASSGPMSPAAVMAKWMSRSASTAVVGLAEALSAETEAEVPDIFLEEECRQIQYAPPASKQRDASQISGFIMFMGFWPPGPAGGNKVVRRFE